jgi:hypothetical protein
MGPRPETLEHGSQRTVNGEVAQMQGPAGGGDESQRDRVIREALVEQLREHPRAEPVGRPNFGRGQPASTKRVISVRVSPLASWRRQWAR